MTLTKEKVDGIEAGAVTKTKLAFLVRARPGRVRLLREALPRFTELVRGELGRHLFPSPGGT